MASSVHARTVRAIGDVLWSQWRSLGVPASALPAQRLIDPEALIVYTAVFTDAFGDDRLRDGAVSWCVQHHGLVATTRVKKLRARVNIGAPDAFARFAHQVEQHVKRLSWGVTVEAPPWRPSAKVRLPRLDEDSMLLRLRCRSMFGANARGESAAFLACAGDWAMLAAIERDTLYSRTQISDALEGLVQARWVLRSWLGNATRFGLTEHARGELTTPIVEHQIGAGAFDVIRSPAAPAWIDWQARFELMWYLAEAAASLDADDLIGALAILRMREDDFRLVHMSVPFALHADDDLDERCAEIAQFLAVAVSNLGGREILP